MIEKTTSTTPGTEQDSEQGAQSRQSSGQQHEDQAADTGAAPQEEQEVEQGEHATDGGADGVDRTPALSESTEGSEDDEGTEHVEGTEGSGEQEEPEESDAERVARLESEGDAAADYLEELLDIVDIDGDIDLDVEGDRAVVAVVGGNLKRLTGEDGSVLEALQELTRLAVLRETGGRSRLMLDVDGYRAKKREDLAAKGAKAADKAHSSGEAVRMDPMTPFERKVVHDAVAAKGMTSESEGEEPNRRVVVRPS